MSLQPGTLESPRSSTGKTILLSVLLRNVERPRRGRSCGRGGAEELAEEHKIQAEEPDDVARAVELERLEEREPASAESGNSFFSLSFLKECIVRFIRSKVSSRSDLLPIAYLLFSTMSA